jgi:hypothetical protein
MTLTPNDTTQITQKCTYIIWNLWKEQCRRVIDNRAMTEDQLSFQKLNVQQWLMAHRPPIEVVASE